jgi:hypothetical protein
MIGCNRHVSQHMQGLGCQEGFHLSMATINVAELYAHQLGHTAVAVAQWSVFSRHLMARASEALVLHVVHTNPYYTRLRRWISICMSFNP